MISLFGLYWVFFKFGLLCFGGGYMLVPLLTAELVGPGKPLAPEEFANLLSIAQATPGPIGINTATYVGYTQHGVTGAVLATLGMITPAMILVILAIRLLKRCCGPIGRRNHPFANSARFRLLLPNGVRAAYFACQ